MAPSSQLTSTERSSLKNLSLIAPNSTELTERCRYKQFFGNRLQHATDGFFSNSTNIVITDFHGTVVEEVRLPSNGNVCALAFNSNHEFLANTDKPG
jgi:hypothetical protein